MSFPMKRLQVISAWTFLEARQVGNGHRIHTAYSCCFWWSSPTHERDLRIDPGKGVICLWVDCNYIYILSPLLIHSRSNHNFDKHPRRCLSPENIVGPFSSRLQLILNYGWLNFKIIYLIKRVASFNLNLLISCLAHFKLIGRVKKYQPELLQTTKNKKIPLEGCTAYSSLPSHLNNTKKTKNNI